MRRYPLADCWPDSFPSDPRQSRFRCCNRPTICSPAFKRAASSDEIEPQEARIWFALAAYNAGPGHLTDARRLAERLGRDPNLWSFEMEQVMPLLARSEYHRRARKGYCRCSEPVRYVRRIRQLYRAYAEAVAGTAPD